MNNASLNSYAVNGNLPLINAVRVLIVAYAYAVATPIGRAVDASKRFIVDTYGYANAAITARILSPVKVDGSGSASTSLTLRGLIRDTLPKMAFAGGYVIGNSQITSYISSPIFGYAIATETGFSRMGARSLVSGSALANSSPMGMALMRSMVSGTAQAVGYVHPTSAIRLPFDKKAIQENTFMVPAKVGTFYVR